MQVVTKDEGNTLQFQEDRDGVGALPRNPMESGIFWRHAVLGMTPVMPSPGSCRVTPCKHRLLQCSRASLVSTARHDPEA